MPTVVIITSVSLNGARSKRSDDQSNVEIETMNITATSAPIGMSTSQSERTRMKTSRKPPAASVERRPRPPDFTLITDCPIIAQPAIPPKKPDTILAMPCPRASRFLSLGVSVISSTIDAVRSDSMRPTRASASATGKMIRNVSRLNGTAGRLKKGSVEGSAPMSPTRLSASNPPTPRETTVSATIATSGDGTAVVKRGRR